MPTEWIIVLIIGLLLLFSAKKLPDMARGLGQSMRIFKAETRGMREDAQTRKSDPAPAIGEAAPGRATTNGTGETAEAREAGPTVTPPGSTGS